MQLSYWDQYVIRLSPRESLEKVALRLRIDRLNNVIGVWEILTWSEKGENSRLFEDLKQMFQAN